MTVVGSQLVQIQIPVTVTIVVEFAQNTSLIVLAALNRKI